MCPAAGQGALALETRDDGKTGDGGAAREIARKLDHAETRAAVTAERALLAVLEGGCQVPIGAHAHLEGSSIHLRAIVASPDGQRVIRDSLCGEDAIALGHELGRRLLAAGAREILAS
jgi:hydroxymethylbilane synthase